MAFLTKSWTDVELKPLRKEGTCFNWPEESPWLKDYTDDPESPDRELAIEICGDCPVRGLCAAQAWDEGLEFGIWGGVDMSRKNFPRSHPGLRMLRTGKQRYGALGRTRRGDDLEGLVRDWTIRDIMAMSMKEWAEIMGVELPHKAVKPCPFPDHEAKKRKSSTRKSCDLCYDHARNDNARWISTKYPDAPFPLRKKDHADN